jgi:F-box/leucine-rich repeat protein 2/20
VLSLLAQMVASKTVTDDRLAAFFMIARRVLNLAGCCAIRNSVLRQIPFRCPELVRPCVLDPCWSETLTLLPWPSPPTQRCLDLSNCAQVTNSVVRAVLQGCSSLQTLRLDGCRHITDAAFQPDHSPFYPLRACTSLQVVSFARCSQLTKHLVLFLVKACRSLTDINFSRCKVRTVTRASLSQEL